MTLKEKVTVLEEKGFDSIDVVSINVSRGKKLGRYTLMEAINPIYIISGVKEWEDEEKWRENSLA